jgi:CelD/BcsL family acetyltransferase involved in cellulose biosynthesis
MEIKVIKDTQGMRDLKDDWNNLLQDNQSNTIFLTWEWLNAWWEVFRDGRKLAILAFWDKDELIGIAPFLQRKARHFYILSYNRIEFLASGEDEEDEICSEYLNIITKKGKEEEVVNAMVEYFEKNNSWDEIILNELSADNINTKVLIDKLKKSTLFYSVKEQGCSYYIDLPDSWSDMLKRLSANFRYKINRDKKLLGQKGEVNFKVVKEYKDLERIFDRLVFLHQKRWNMIGKSGSFASNKFNQFHKRIMQGLFDKDLLRLSFLEFNDEVIAVFYDFVYNNNIYFYQSGFEPDFDRKIAIGHVLRAYCLENYINEGKKEYDFLKGDTGYKAQWAENCKRIYQIRICRNTGKENIYRILNNFKNIAARLKGFVKLN